MKRPIPPELPENVTRFVPADALGDWARACFIAGGSPLTNPDHAHLQQASIGWLWTNGIAENRGRRIAGEARMPRPAGSRWSQMMAEAQLLDLFGDVPDFIITIDAELAAMASDDEFCALIEHEMYHCAQAVGVFGEPRFTREGRPVFTMRGHDVEQFVGVVARYGAGASGVAAMVEAAGRGPRAQDGAVALACGTCAMRKAA
jgi:hypothetical protein